MPYLFHAYLCVFLQMAGFIGGALLALLYGNGWGALPQAVLFIGCPLAGVYLAVALESTLITVRA